MIAKQLSIFIENRKGRLGEVLRVLKENSVNILSLSLADTTEYGLLRLIVDNYEEGEKRLKEAGFSTMISDILILKISHSVGSLQRLLNILAENDINIEYMYGLSIEGQEAFIVVKTGELDRVINILKKEGVETMSSDDISKM